MTTDIRPPNDSADWEALARFFSGESPEPEAETIRRWLFEHPRESSALAALDGLVGRLDVQMPAETADVGAAGTRDPSVDDAWRRVAERLDEPVVLPLSAPRPAVRPLPRPAWRTGWRTGALRAAATVALVAAGSLVWRGTHGGDEGPAVAARTFSTPVGTRDSTVLADGSRVLLGPGSSLQTTEGYGGDRREVRLDGEALFEVRHDAARPFVVRAAGAVIRDLGTAFSVRSADSSG
ncbi:MAG: FecR domain-containing protein [Gemmatimonadaceae bacterium]